MALHIAHSENRELGPPLPQVHLRSLLGVVHHAVPIDAINGELVAPDQALDVAGHQDLAEQWFDLVADVGDELEIQGLEVTLLIDQVVPCEGEAAGDDLFRQDDRQQQAVAVLGFLAGYVSHAMTGFAIGRGIFRPQRPTRGVSDQRVRA